MNEIHKHSRQLPRSWVLVLPLLGAAFLSAQDADLPRESGLHELTRFPQRMGASLARTHEGTLGLVISWDGKTLLQNPHPIQIELFAGGEVVTLLKAGYQSFRSSGNDYSAMGSVVYKGAEFSVNDLWSVKTNTLVLDRKVTVRGSFDGGFMSGITLPWNRKASRDEVQLFAPGMIYGSTAHLTPSAIGGNEGEKFVRIREDRLPTPMLGAYFENHLSLTILNSKPDGRTTKGDSQDMGATPMIDSGFGFGALAADFDEENPSLGYWFPGTEGGVTYKGQTYPYGQIRKWLRRYHPVSDGFGQSYQVSFQVGSHGTFPEYYADVSRWAWDTLKPKVAHHDIRAVKASLLKQLSEMVMTRNGVTGVQSLCLANTSDKDPTSMFGFNIRMGFVGRSLEAASFLLADSLDETNPNREEYRRQGEAIINTFAKLGMSPPEAEGFMNGKPFAKNNRIFLRSMTDAHRELLKCVVREAAAGKKHAPWLAWSKSFADWLLPQQTEAGGFPRIWMAGTGEVLDASPHSSYNVVVFLILLDHLTGDSRYGEAAIKAAEFCWETSHSDGVFIGGTSDNPDVIDKEAGTLSLEAYLALYKHTSDKKWLKRAQAAADFAQTWIYTWNVPMPSDVPDETLHWKRGASTVGMQLIASGHSLADQNMSYDVDEFAELYLATKDPHYYEVARILLHNTKSMLALPGRTFDLRGPGWMQEHWSIAPQRGVGQNRVWVCWVTTSQLNGIIELEELDKGLFQEMIGP